MALSKLAGYEVDVSYSVDVPKNFCNKHDVFMTVCRPFNSQFLTYKLNNINFHLVSNQKRPVQIRAMRV
jgi:hypothetical protein